MAKLTEVKNPDGSLKTYKKMIGKRFFFLGKDRVKAESLADELGELWRAKKAIQGKSTAWTKEEIRQATEKRATATAEIRATHSKSKGNNSKNLSITAVMKKGKLKTWTKHIGKKQFFLGPDKDKAEQLALQIIQKWKTKKAIQGESTAWTKEEIKGIKSIREQLYNRQEYDSIFDSTIEPQSDIQVFDNMEDSSYDDVVITVKDAKKKWIKAIEESGRSPQNRNTLVNRLKNLGKNWDDIQDEDISKLNYETIYSIIEQNIRLVKDDKQSAQTAKNKISAFRLFIEYCHNAQTIEYTAFANYKDEISKQLKRLSTELKQAKKKVQKDNKLNDIDILKNLYNNATGSLKGYMLLALNTGQLNTDIASLTLGMVNLEKGIIERERHKTGVEGRWILWQETKDFLFKAINEAKIQGRTKQDDLIFVTQQGKPLVHFSRNNARTDSITLAWQKLKKKCGYNENGYAFANLRKSSSQFIRQEKGKEYSEAFLAHSDNTMAEHYNRFSDYAGLFEALQQYRRHLDPMFK